MPTERQRSLPGFADRAPPDRYCDLVLTGGVTSAIAYPGLIHALAQAYRLQAIGGSSSGAGSAALAAAAEYRRRHGSADGYRALLARTAAVADDFGGRTGLAWLFQPNPPSRRLFGALLPAFAGPKRSAGAFALDLLGAYRAAVAAGVAAGIGFTVALAALSGLPGTAAWAFGAALCGLLLGAFGLAAALWRDIARTADADYGLCSGQHRDPGAPHPPLTAWLHELIQDVAGLPPERPLNFADLWAAPGGPRELLGDRGPGGERSIDLRMFAANVSLGRPLLLPLADDEPALYFRPAELRRLFPPAVVDYMVAQSAAYDGPAEIVEPRRAAARGDGDADSTLYTLPRAQLPIVVAARMSVSFPVLFSAVPLWQRCGSGRRFRRLLFADGGLCSNFPIHLFDSPIPAWPTFGVALHDDGGEAAADPACAAAWVHLPDRHDRRPLDRYQAFDQAATPRARLLGFAGAMLATTKDWNDALLAEMPGVRERIAQVALPANIGGLNILMDAGQIEWLAQAGGEAARQLLARYAVPDRGGAQASGWREHRWVRLNVLAACLQDDLAGLARAAEFARHAEPLREQIRRAIDEPPLQGEARLLPAQAAALQRTLEALLQIERALTPRPLAQPYRPEPRPQLRIRPPM